MPTTNRRRSKSPAVRSPSKKSSAKSDEHQSEDPANESSLISWLSKYTAPLAIAIWLATSIYIIIEGRNADPEAKDLLPNGVSTVSGLALACLAVASHKESETKTRLIMVPVALSFPVWILKLDINHVRSFAGVVFIITCSVVFSVLVDHEDGWNIWRMFFEDTVGAPDKSDDRNHAKRSNTAKRGTKSAAMWALFRVVNWAMGVSFVVCASCALYENFEGGRIENIWQSELVPRSTWSLLSFCYLFGAFFATKLAH
jgi:hypothetical protein